MARRAERAMQELNEAWRVLRDPARRRAYDARLLGGAAASGPGAATRPGRAGGWPQDLDGELDADLAYAASGTDDVGARVVRGLPWLVAVVVLVTVFVFTAYAGGGGDSERAQQPLVGSCVRVQQGLGAVRVPCSGPSDGEVRAAAARPSACPPGTTARPVPGEAGVLCLAAPRS